jgi:hypothetical protein
MIRLVVLGGTGGAYLICALVAAASYVWDGTRPVEASAPFALGDRYPADPRLRRSLSPLVTP